VLDDVRRRLVGGERQVGRHVGRRTLPREPRAKRVTDVP
jgi:hypothetical protein